MDTLEKTFDGGITGYVDAPHPHPERNIIVGMDYRADVEKAKEKGRPFDILHDITFFNYGDPRVFRNRFFFLRQLYRGSINLTDVPDPRIIFRHNQLELHSFSADELTEIRIVFQIERHRHRWHEAGMSSCSIITVESTGLTSRIIEGHRVTNARPFEPG